ncbi:MAG: DUF1552 domain-containing protein [Opitutae bacterium]|nr:DUF1552 domain-containing protein [Opitutae bacterium]MBT4225606.1 DUF1552 domain-containing protein [Opitutae bacterium]MBT5378332.1 DUF1552 domain-containing protein [Opitutae bacterium]MBT5692588.1 DUF1552 domain-containing protein [Opitutae bacterium]
MNITRRNMLRGISMGSGSIVFSPLIDQLAAQAAGKSAFPQRFVFVVKSSGLTPGHVVPTNFADDYVIQKKSYIAGEGYTSGVQLKDCDKLVKRPLKDAVLNNSMKSLEPFKDRLTILQGLSGNMVTGGHTSGYGAMSCMKDLMAETIDHKMSRLYPSVFSHLGLSTVTTTMGSRFADSVCYPGISAASNTKTLPFYGSAVQAYQSLFGSVATGKDRTKFESRGNLFDYLSEDVKAMRRHLVGSEKEKLDHHLNAIEALQAQRQGILSMSDQINKGKPELTGKYTNMNIEDRFDAHCQIAAGALISGLTNVVTIRADGLGSQYTQLGFVGGQVHGIGHGKVPEGADSTDHARGLIRGFQLDNVAKIASRLATIPEGNGTMLDNTTILYFSDVGDKHHASNREWPYIVIGDMGGKLKSAGQYIQYPHKGHSGHHTIASWWLTLLHAAGHLQDGFGMKDKKVDAMCQRGPLGELLG